MFDCFGFGDALDHMGIERVTEVQAFKHMVAFRKRNLALVGEFDGDAIGVCPEDLGIGRFVYSECLVLFAPENGLAFMEGDILGVVE